MDAEVVAPVRSTGRDRVELRLSPKPLHHSALPECGVLRFVVTVRVRERDDERLDRVALRGEVGLAQLDRGVRAERDDLVVEPAELELLPRAHVAGRRADRVGAVVEPRAAAHQGPEAGAVVAAVRCRRGRAGRGRGRTRGRRRRGRRSRARSCSRRSRCRCYRSGMPPSLLPSGPTLPAPVELTYQRCDQIASVPCAPPPASSPSPAWMAWKWSM